MRKSVCSRLKVSLEGMVDSFTQRKSATVNFGGVRLRRAVDDAGVSVIAAGRRALAAKRSTPGSS